MELERAGHSIGELPAPTPQQRPDGRGFDTAERRPRADAPPRLSLRGITHRFGRLTAVDRASLDIAPGEIVSLLGPSGCGKTTLLRIAAGIERQTAGEVLIDGETVASANIFVPAEERSLGLVFQDFALFPHLTVLQNAIYGMRGLAKNEARRRARVALARLGLDAYESAYPHMLSGGEQQRVALVRALLPGPRVMLLDEPFSGLDRGLRGAVREETVAVLRETGATALMVTHDPFEALEVSDRVALMREGRIVQIGTPEDVWRRPVDLAAARFFSEINVVEARVAGGTAATAFGAIGAPSLADGAMILVAFRPQSLYIATDGSGVEARVDSVGFVGDAYQLHLRIAGIDEPMSMRTAMDARPQPGDRLRIAVKHGEALLFAAE